MSRVMRFAGDPKSDAIWWIYFFAVTLKRGVTQGWRLYDVMLSCLCHDICIDKPSFQVLVSELGFVR